ncbi:hypothetical protein TR13x_07525 [Caloranaerobacter sp. TR13]|uniref:hypothetical protein n=1 Tax=Caloranaerobacter sp. TR13 TaxID=1302151 RepID=UPI0006D45107|nr:hypothetical protein [Caloranaerobacter sp. TR13]KPU26969.1 hypothetical protein TR13x_07525 [Caloranaerobacter sp. TR13]
MDFKNEKSKIYKIGGTFLRLGVIISSVIVILNKDIDTKFRLSVIMQIFFILFMVLLGTQELMARRNKIGYVYYFIAGLIFWIFINIILI